MVDIVKKCGGFYIGNIVNGILWIVMCIELLSFEDIDDIKKRIVI